MKLTDEQQKAVKHNGNAFVVACPGSGKTRAIVAKLLRCVDELRDGPRRVACITYTNTAVHEIEHRIRIYGATGDEEYCEVSTIHSFCQNNILRHFYWRLEDYSDGFVVLPSDSDQYTLFVEQVATKHGLDGFAQQQFESLNRRPNGEPICPGNIPPEAAKEFWQLLKEHGYIDFCNIVYYSFRLLKDDPSLARNLASRFAYILVDEFQDTSALQVAILKLIGSHKRTTFFLVGDPEQSIYRFAGADRSLMFQFAEDFEAERFPLSGNFRCSPLIVKCAEALIPRSPAMFSTGDATRLVDIPIRQGAENNFTAITDYFLPALGELKIPFGRAAILSQNWYQLMPLGRQLREYGVPVVGPGARPYKKKHLFASLAEQVCAYVDNPVSTFIPQAERELFFLVQNVTGKANFSVFTYQGRRAVFRLFREGQKLQRRYEGAREWLHAAAESFSEILHHEGLLPASARSLLTESASDILRDMEDKKVDVANLTLSGLGMFANPTDNLKLMSLHGAKGREFEAVAIVAVQDGFVPYHNKHNPLSSDGLEEARRLFYVGLTRAKRVLMLFTNNEDWRPDSRFLDELGLESN